MRIRRIAVLIDGAFFVKRLPRIVPAQYHNSPKAVADSARLLCKRHVQRLIGERYNTDPSRWLDHVYRLFYYDARPFTEVAHHPLRNEQIHYAKTPEAHFRNMLFSELRRRRKFALRLGRIANEDGWRIKHGHLTKKLLRIRDWISILEAAVAHSRSAAPMPRLTEKDASDIEKTIQAWRELRDDDVRLGLRQKGVDMRIGLDISTLTLKKQVDTIVLVTGDSDFVPAAKLARREGVEFLLDPLWQSVEDELHEHVDGVVSAFRQPDLQTALEDDCEDPAVPESDSDESTSTPSSNL